MLMIGAHRGASRAANGMADNGAETVISPVGAAVAGMRCGATW